MQVESLNFSSNLRTHQTLVDTTQVFINLVAEGNKLNPVNTSLRTKIWINNQPLGYAPRFARWRKKPGLREEERVFQTTLNKLYN